MTLEILLLSLLAGFIMLDVSFIGQIGVSRPIVCSPLLGIILGDIYTGIKIGAVLELCWLNVLPVGAAIPLDICAVSMLATIWAILSGSELYGCIIAIILAIPCGIVFDRLEILHRKLNRNLIYILEQNIHQGKENKIDFWVYLTVLLTYLRCLLFFILFIPLGVWLIPEIIPWVKSNIQINKEFVCSSMLILGLAVALKVFWPRKLQLDFHGNHQK